MFKTQFSWATIKFCSLILQEVIQVVGSYNMPFNLAQWCTQDEQVTHGHIQCMRNTHLLGELGHAPAMKIFFKSYTLRLLLDHHFQTLPEMQ